MGRILAASRAGKARMVLTTIYGCGLRVSEAVALRVGDIDGERALVHVMQGKGARDRMVMLSPALLGQLRRYWRAQRAQRPHHWLFPGREPGRALAVPTVQKLYTRAKARARVEKVGGVHALRHAYATHQLEAGVPVHLLQRLLGHGSVHSTMRYVHWVPGYREGAARHCDLVAAVEAGR